MKKDRRKSFRERLHLLGFSSYVIYLRSDSWRQFRVRFLRDYPICEVCGEQAEAVHHRNYNRLGNERDKDVVAVCATCHAEIHRLEKQQGILIINFQQARKLILKALLAGPKPQPKPVAIKAVTKEKRLGRKIPKAEIRKAKVAANAERTRAKVQRRLAKLPLGICRRG